MSAGGASGSQEPDTSVLVVSPPSSQQEAAGQTSLSVKLLASPLDTGLAAGIALLRWDTLDLAGKVLGLHTARPIVKDRTSLPGLLR
jgi:hypothetical protein